MININFGPNFILGIFISLIGICFYIIRFINPKIAEEKDIFLCTLLLMYSGVMVVHGWRLDPILFYSQLIVVFLLMNFCLENLSLRLSLLQLKKKRVIKRIFKENERREFEKNQKRLSEKSIEPINIFDIFK